MLGLLPNNKSQFCQTELVFNLNNTEWLKSAIWQSLATDRRALPSDNVVGDLRGFWGDSYRKTPIGSRLWLLGREKTINETLLKAEDYARESLQWLIDENIADSLDIRVAWRGGGVLDMFIGVEKDKKHNTFNYLWEF